MGSAADHGRKPSRRLRRRLVLVASLLLAIALFLNYRPRYPVEFSTRYGKTPSRQEMIDAICRLRGEEVRGQLQFVRDSDRFPSEWSTFTLPATGEEFNVWWADTQVRTWKLGRYQPPLGVPAAPTEAYHRAFMKRYYPWVPAKRMHLIVRLDAPRPLRAFEYDEVAGGAIASMNRCRLVWDKPIKRLETVIFGFTRIQSDAPPRITRREAERIAMGRALRTRGLISAKRGDHFRAKDAPEFRDKPEASLDELGVQRCIYDVNVKDLKWQPWARPKSGCLCDIIPTDGVPWVDAQTGAAFPFMIGPFWGIGILQQRLGLSTPAGELWSINYPALRLWGMPYICGRYLQSDLWAGKYSFDRRSGAFTVEDQGLRWTGRRGSPLLHGPEGLSMSWMPPRMIDGELYLPTTMIRRITGWTMGGGWGWLTLKPPGVSAAKP